MSCVAMMVQSLLSRCRKADERDSFQHNDLVDAKAIARERCMLGAHVHMDPHSSWVVGMVMMCAHVHVRQDHHIRSIATDDDAACCRRRGEGRDNSNSSSY